jgi:hypothetical protein
MCELFGNTAYLLLAAGSTCQGTPQQHLVRPLFALRDPDPSIHHTTARWSLHLLLQLKAPAIGY